MGKTELKTKAKAPAKHAREWAEAELNRWFEAVGVEEEDRVDLDDADISEEEDFNIEDESVKKLDLSRETVIKAIQRKHIVVNDDNELVMTLRTPVKGDKTGTIRLESLTFKTRYKGRDFASYAAQIKPDDIYGQLTAKAAAISGKTPQLIGAMFNKDYDLAHSIALLFMRAD